MSDESIDRTMKIISDHHHQIVDFARKAYSQDGRGSIEVQFPNVPPGATAIGVSMMSYHKLDELRRLFARELAGNEDAAILMRMMETYHPERQAVVTATIEGENPITIKMKLERPFIVDEPEGVQ
jgi:hypothetical protein